MRFIVFRTDGCFPEVQYNFTLEKAPSKEEAHNILSTLFFKEKERMETFLQNNQKMQNDADEDFGPGYFGEGLRKMKQFLHNKEGVYFFYNEETNQVKIGMSQSIYARYRSICFEVKKTLIPLALYFPKQHETRYTAEKKFHKKYSKYRVGRTEWFTAPEDLIQKINKSCSVFFGDSTVPILYPEKNLTHIFPQLQSDFCPKKRGRK
jgi:hypothetical protein